MTRHRAGYRSSSARVTHTHTHTDTLALIRTISRASTAIAATTVVLSGCAGKMPVRHPGAGVPLIRIGLAVGAAKVEVGATGPYRIDLLHSRRSSTFADSSDHFVFYGVSGGQIHVNDGEGLDRGEVDRPYRLTPESVESRVLLNGVAYRGILDVIPKADGTLTAINIVDMENYLRGVLPNEIGTRDPAIYEAVKAQAVAARTYSVNYHGRRIDLGFDLYASTEDQLYTGVAAETPGSDRAIQETWGMLADYDGTPIRANYSSTCGGKTASNDEVWEQPALPYLRGIKDTGRGSGDAFCEKSTYYRWTETWNADEFAAKFRDAYRTRLKKEPPEGALKDVKVRDRTKSGRVKDLEVKFEDGEVHVGKDMLRWYLTRPAGGILRSSRFDIEVDRSDGKPVAVIAKGSGWGHGVGLCQWGAMEMARDGHGYEDILRHYYHGIKIEKWY